MGRFGGGLLPSEQICFEHGHFTRSFYCLHPPRHYFLLLPSRAHHPWRVIPDPVKPLVHLADALLCLLDFLVQTVEEFVFSGESPVKVRLIVSVIHSVLYYRLCL